MDRQNVVYLQDALTLFENYERGGRLAPLQVGLLKQQLLQGQSQVLQSTQKYQNSVDGFKLQLGVPQNVPLELDDCVVRGLTDQLKRYDKAIKDYEATSDKFEKFLESRKGAETRQVLRGFLTTSPLAAGTTNFKKAAYPTWEKWCEAFPDTKRLKARVNVLEGRIRTLIDERENPLDNKARPGQGEGAGHARGGIPVGEAGGGGPRLRGRTVGEAQGDARGATGSITGWPARSATLFRSS